MSDTSKASISQVKVTKKAKTYQNQQLQFLGLWSESVSLGIKSLPANFGVISNISPSKKDEVVREFPVSRLIDSIQSSERLKRCR